MKTMLIYTNMNRMFAGRGEVDATPLRLIDAVEIIVMSSSQGIAIGGHYIGELTLSEKVTEGIGTLNQRSPFYEAYVKASTGVSLK